MNHADRRYGFTIVELMLAMGFVSALLLAIAMTVIQIGNIYNRGITFKNVNQVGGSIANELQRSISGSKSFSVKPLAIDPDTKFINNAFSGRLCTGKYSYVWNYGKYLKDPVSAGSDFIKYKGQAAGVSPMINFSKVYDSNYAVCTKTGAVYPDINSADSIELINTGQFDLAIQAFTIKSEDTAIDSTTGQQLYEIEFYLGTNDWSAYDLTSATPSCLVSGQNANPTYCSVIRFNVLARAGSSNNE